jgi:hypothetical protein
VTYDEDRSSLRNGHTPQIMAALRNLAISLLRLAGFTAIASATRRLAALPWQALALIGHSPHPLTFIVAPCRTTRHVGQRRAGVAQELIFLPPIP